MTRRGTIEITAYIGLGSNLDDPAAQVEQAIGELAKLDGVALQRRSSLYRNPPLGDIEQPDFVNAAAEICTSLTALELLESLQKIETRHGRQRNRRWGPRTLDLDILLFGEQILTEGNLVVPHPHLHERAFVLIPLMEINREINVPGMGRVSDLSEAVDSKYLERISDRIDA